MMPEDEFSDMMPHRIKVTGAGGENGYDDYGNPIPGSPAERTYACLIDDTTSTVRSADGEQITVALTAYVWAVPVDPVPPDGLPVDIESEETVEILSPRPDQHPNLTSIERHYYAAHGEGYLHNLVLRFT